MIWQALLAIAAFIVTSPDSQHGSATDDYEIDIRQKALENEGLFGGDMLISHEEWKILGNGIANVSFRWPGYPGAPIIPYIIDSSLSGQKKLIEDAMTHYQDNTCVKFKVRTTEIHYVKIFKGTGCYAAIGRNASASQPLPVSLGTGCHDIGTVIHELGHVLGFYHEQNRSDRDNYIDVYLTNVQQGAKGNFIKLNATDNLLFNSFDYDSIMIYGNYAFSKQPNVLKTMEAKNGHTLLNPYTKTKMTDSDIERVNKLYKCP